MDDISLTLLTATVTVVTVVSITLKIVMTKNKKKQKGNVIQGNGNSLQNGENNASISVGSITNIYSGNSQVNRKESERRVFSVDQIKNELKVIFVDDKKFNVVELLKKNGWKQVSYKRDIKDIDSVEVREAHVFFLDINGVGVAMGFHNQGMGLCGAIKRKYGDKKRVVLYSGETSGDIFDNDARMADDTLKKDSDLYQFTSLMEQYGKELL